MLTRKSIARTAAATAGLALVATGVLVPAGAAEGGGSDRGQARAAAAQAQGADRAERRSGNAEGAGSPDRARASKGRSAGAPHGNAYGHEKPEDAPASPQGPRDPASQGDTDQGDNGLGDERGGGHTPVTVCHALGNGGFVEITFDENAFEKHLENHMKHMEDHQDYVPEEGEGCAQAAPVTTDDVDADTVTRTVAERETVTDAQILGVEAFAARAGAGAQAPAVLGSEAVAADAVAAPASGPVAGILPQTGAAPVALAAAAGLGLVGAGATMLARRRREV
ncbi:MAG: LPXTG cell wall anchor domain-containing protein [Actinomycetes bacterium]